MADRLVEVLTRDHADQPVGLADEHPALAVALAQDHRVRDGVVHGDEAGRPRHDLARGQAAAHRVRERLEHGGARVLEGAPVGRGRRLRMAAASQGRRDRRGIELGHPRPDHAEDPAVHLDEADERAAVGEVDDLVREVGDALDVLRPPEPGHEHLVAARLVRLEARDERVEERALALGERRVQVLRHHLLARAVPHAPGQGLRVADRRPCIAQGARVLVDAEGEGGRLDRAHLDLALRQDRDHGRRQSSVLGADRVLGPHPVELLARMVVEEDDLDLGASRSGLELAEALGMRRLDDDQALDLCRVDPPRLGHVQLLRVQAVEVAHVAVERSGERDDGIRVEPPRGQHGRERVEIGVRVGDDDLHAAKVRPASSESRPFR